MFGKEQQPDGKFEQRQETTKPTFGVLSHQDPLKKKTVVQKYLYIFFVFLCCEI